MFRVAGAQPCLATGFPFLTWGARSSWGCLPQWFLNACLPGGATYKGDCYPGFQLPHVLKGLAGWSLCDGLSLSVSVSPRACLLLLVPAGGQTCLGRWLWRAPAQRTLFSAPETAVGSSRRMWKKPAPSQAWPHTCQEEALGLQFGLAAGRGSTRKRPFKVPAARLWVHLGPVWRPRPAWWSLRCKLWDRGRTCCLAPGSISSCPQCLPRGGPRPARGSWFLSMTS